MASQTYSHINTSLSSPTHPITLRTMCPGDGAAFAALLAEDNPKLDAAWGEGAIGRMRETALAGTVVDGNDQVLSGPKAMNLGVVVDDKLVGISGFGAIKDWERNGRKIRAGDAGVVLDPAYRGKGYATEATKLAMDWAVAPAKDGGLQLDLLTITTLSDNKSMIKLIEKGLGLDKSRGILRPAEFDKEKQELYFEIPVDEWRKMRKSQ